MGAFVRAGQRVCLKVNLLRPSAPERAVTTHPAVVRGVAEAVRAAGATPFLADSPGGGIPYTRGALERCYRGAGYGALAAEGLVELNYDTGSREVRYPEGKILRRFNVIAPVLDADVVINLPKLKTHAYTYFTGAVKNLFGVLPGYDKPALHARLKTVEPFADMLLDVALFVNPALTVMDAVVGMEGNGPGLGDPRLVGLIFASPSHLAVDVAAGEVVGLSPQIDPVLRAAAARDLQPHNLGQLNVVGENLAAVRVPDWRWPPTVVAAAGFAGFGAAQRLLAAAFRTSMSVQPRVVPVSCTGCAACRDACPAGAIEMINEKARVEEKMCIRCYCCHEACPEDAIVLRRSLAHRLFARALGTPAPSQR
jgi:uncharacterized protein (DUF362 family)/Pyruvate/2-oxoacid:ferredoxin oxidoreductase delta subunit